MKKNLELGFTLLELVLVLFILAILSSVTVAFLDSENGQARFDASMDKLDAIGLALLRENEYRGAMVISGLIADNGVIQDSTITDVEPLIADDAAWSDVAGNTWLLWGEQTPYYNTGGGAVGLAVATNPQFLLRKGFRGRYLRLGLDSNQEFLDGWGEPYLIASAGNDYTYTFDGTTARKTAAYQTDVVRSLVEDDWTIAPAALTIRVHNDLPANSGNNDLAIGAIEIAVSVFVNSSVTDLEDRWSTFHFTNSEVIPENGGTYESTLAAWEVNGASVTTERVPVGEHLVLLIDNAVTADGESEVVDSAHALIFPRASSQPEVELVFD